MMGSSDFILALLVSFFSCLILTGAMIFVARRLGIMDVPNAERKIHKKPTPLLGGLAIFLSFNLVVLLYSFFTNDLTGDTILLKNIIGICVGSLFLAIGGVLDDKYNLKPWQQIIWPIMSVVAVIVAGIGIDWITNPFGQGLWYLNESQITLFWYHGLSYKFTIFSDIFTFVWLMGMIYTTKLLDGLDGLVSGVTIIGAIFVFLTALNRGEIVQYDVALLALILLGVFAGFLVLNFNPASIFLGESGSTLAGFLLGSISIISGSKIGVTLLLLGIPVLDFLWTIIRRLMERKSPFGTSDRKHLHHRLIDAGFSVKRAVFFLYSIVATFGVFAYYAQGSGIGFFSLAFIVLLVFMLIMAYLYKRKREQNKALTAE